jgi:hypothetical protein
VERSHNGSILFARRHLVRKMMTSVSGSSMLAIELNVDWAADTTLITGFEKQ